MHDGNQSGHVYIISLKALDVLSLHVQLICFAYFLYR